MRLWDLPPRLRRATEAKCVAEESLHRGPEGPLCESVKVKPGLFGYYMRLEMPEPKDTCQATDMEWKQPKREKCAVTKAGRVESSQSSDIRLWSFPCWVCSLALVQHYLAELPFLPFGMVTYVPCHCV